MRLHPVTQADLLSYARELDRQTELVKALLDGRGPSRAVSALIAGDDKLRAKLSLATRDLGLEGR